MANTAPVFSLPSSFAIKSKLVEPVNPYNKEQPYSNKPANSTTSTWHIDWHNPSTGNDWYIVDYAEKSIEVGISNNNKGDFFRVITSNGQIVLES